MISIATLQSAKAFLCWDALPGLAVQLAPIEKAAAWYFPAEHNIDRILVFYHPNSNDQKKALFYLFHEAGHVLQKQNYEKSGEMATFLLLLELDKGDAKARFEKEAWNKGLTMLESFTSGHEIGNTILQGYEEFALQCVASYRD